MILGRTSALWLGLVAAVLNSAVIVFHVQLDSTQLTALNALAFAIVGVLANEQNPDSAGTFAPTTRSPGR